MTWDLYVLTRKWYQVPSTDSKFKWNSAWHYNYYSILVKVYKNRIFQCCQFSKSRIFKKLKWNSFLIFFCYWKSWFLILAIPYYTFLKFQFLKTGNTVNMRILAFQENGVVLEQPFCTLLAEFHLNMWGNQKVSPNYKKKKKRILSNITLLP